MKILFTFEVLGCLSRCTYILNFLKCLNHEVKVITPLKENKDVANRSLVDIHFETNIIDNINQYDIWVYDLSENINIKSYIEYLKDFNNTLYICNVDDTYELNEKRKLDYNITKKVKKYITNIKNKTKNYYNRFLINENQIHLIPSFHELLEYTPKSLPFSEKKDVLFFSGRATGLFPFVDHRSGLIFLLKNSYKLSNIKKS